jgi:hypothetical protein
MSYNQATIEPTNALANIVGPKTLQGMVKKFKEDIENADSPETKLLLLKNAARDIYRAGKGMGIKKLQEMAFADLGGHFADTFKPTPKPFTTASAESAAPSCHRPHRSATAPGRDQTSTCSNGGSRTTARPEVRAAPAWSRIPAPPFEP